MPPLLLSFCFTVISHFYSHSSGPYISFGQPQTNNTPFALTATSSFSSSSTFNFTTLGLQLTGGTAASFTGSGNAYGYLAGTTNSKLCYSNYLSSHFNWSTIVYCLDLALPYFGQTSDSEAQSNVANGAESEIWSLGTYNPCMGGYPLSVVVENSQNTSTTATFAVQGGYTVAVSNFTAYTASPIGSTFNMFAGIQHLYFVPQN